jgi:hypothetical protein
MKSDRKKNKKEDLPGYPHYPQSEDITNQEKRIDADLDNLSRANKHDKNEVTELPPVEPSLDYTPEIKKGTSADVTIEDLKTLGPLDSDMDEGEDETLIPSLKIGPDLSGDDLDVPGSELDDDAEARGSEDEENNYYSRGQD